MTEYRADTVPAHPDLGPAARQVAALLEGVRDDQLTGPTPCAEMSVATLLHHLMGLTLAFRYAALKEDPASGGEQVPTGPGQAKAEQLHPEWRERLPRRLDALVAAWQDPAAWQGEAEAGGVTMPAQEMGVVALDEILIHGWDLARATGQRYVGDPVSVAAVFGMLSGMANEDGVPGMFGPVVPVPEDAPLLDRALGLTGRDPSWAAA
ncbi:hypothetical protein ACZ90_01335 [Streptomyces albus subsp. albus]|nr:hypothetical protein ACZ90_01335 [Streptomyces albus subsp. albus]